MSVIHLMVLLPFIGAIAMPILPRILPRIHAGWFVLPVPLALFVYLLYLLPSVNEAGSISATVRWMPSLGVDFTVYLDGLAMLFALLITGIGTLVMGYSIFYMDKSKEKLVSFYVYLMLFMGAMLGLVLSDNAMVLYGFWELTSLSSFLLIAFWHERDKSKYGALKSLIITVFGGLSMFAGMILLFVMTGSFSIREMIAGAEQIAIDPLFVPAMLLLLTGAFTKSAQFPFHIWLPDAMEAPTPVSSYLHSATMVKAGLYLVARFTSVFSGNQLWFWLVTLAGLLTLLYGSYRAIKQTDLKALLAFSTISQLGLIMSLLGLGSAAAFYTDTLSIEFFINASLAAIFHLINHAAFKGALFMVTGLVDHSTGTRDIRRLGGLMAVMPITFTIAVIGTMSMAGMPPFGGFLSKEMFFSAVTSILQFDLASGKNILYLIPIVAWLASIFTFVYSMRMLFKTFAGKRQEEKLEREPHEASLGLLISPAILGTLVILLGLFPNVLSYTILEPALRAIHPSLLQTGDSMAISISFWHGWNVELFMTMGVVAAGVCLYWAYPKVKLLSEPLTRNWSLNRMYDGLLAGSDNIAGKVTRSYMTGSVRHYMYYILIALVVLTGVTMVTAHAFTIDTSSYADASVYETIVLLALIIGAISVPFAKSRLTAILLTGVTGYLVVLFYVIFRAPDLALTQMIIETVSVALFLLCFYHLPKLKKEQARTRFKVFQMLVSLAVGVTVTLIALSASGSKLFDSISDYYVKHSLDLAGGKNIVNVILVDFRGFDTMLEIVVLAIASFGVYGLIKLGEEEFDQNNKQNEYTKGRSALSMGKGSAGKKGGKQHKLAGAAALQPAYYLNSNDVMLQTIGKVAAIVMGGFSLYLMYSGHNQPGGGFIGALVASSALILLAMAFGMKRFETLFPIDFRTITATGLVIAFLTGTASFLFDVPFLTHSFGHIELPLIGSFEWATAMLFDLGVYLTVLGVAVTIIFTIGRDRT